MPAPAIAGSAYASLVPNGNFCDFAPSSAVCVARGISRSAASCIAQFYQRLGYPGPRKRGGAMRILHGCVLAVVLAAAATAHAQEPIIYPAKGQSAQQQDKDKYECYSWAKGQTGFDPMALPTASSAAPQGPNRSVAGGALGGAAAGAAVGAVGGLIDGGGKGAGKGAGIGAGVGGMLGGRGAAGQNWKASKDREQWERRESQNYATNRANYNRAFGACLEGRRYTVR